MSDTVAMIVVVVAVVLVVAVVGALLMRTRGRERRTHEAQELRTQAAAEAVDLAGAKNEAARRQALADEAREQAEVAEAHALEARREVAHAEAQQEDRVREADRIDPQVDHRDPDYRPGEVTPPQHRA